jgi:pyruvate carboxylase
VITPFYDSLLVKVTAWGREFSHACQRMDRALREFRIRGVKTNIPFLENVVNHPAFQAGETTTSFIDQTDELFEFAHRRDRATRLLTYLGEVIVNKNPEVANRPRPAEIRPAPFPPHDASQPPSGHAPIAGPIRRRRLRAVDEIAATVADH